MCVVEVSVQGVVYEGVVNLRQEDHRIILNESVCRPTRGGDTVVHPSMDVLSWLRKELEAADGELLRERVQTRAEVLMSAEGSAHCHARNGYRTRRWDTRVGTIDLAIPPLRRGSYYPDWLLEPRRAERALVAVVAERSLAGVSTRRVDDLVRTLGIQGLSQSPVSALANAAFRNRPLTSGPAPCVWLDALTQRCREGPDRRGGPQRGWGGLDRLPAQLGRPGPLRRPGGDQ